jgi:Flp pilus assembly protein TadD
MRTAAGRRALIVMLVAVGLVGPARADETERIKALADAVQPSVVEILGTIEANGDTSYGTGFVVGEAGLVATNAHVVRGVGDVMVRTRRGALLASVEVLHVEERTDLAVLRVTGLESPPLPLIDGPPPVVGTRVVAVGHPRGYEFTVSDGIVSARRQLDDDGVELIQTTAPISPGSSGGPLVDLAGGVLGVCSLTLMEGQNINFAVPVAHLRRVVRRALEVERALASSDPDTLPPDALARLIRTHREEGDLGRANDLARRALHRHGNSIELLVEAAEVAWSRASYREVEALVARIERLEPDYAPARQIRAAYLAQKGDCEGAVVMAREALDGGLRGEQAAEAHAVLADCLGRMGSVDRALVHVQRALESERIDDLPDYHVLHAFLLQALGRHGEADAAAVKALEVAGWDPLVVAALRERNLPRLVEIVSYRDEPTGQVRVARGVVRNRGPVAITEIMVTAEGFDAAGTIVATGTAPVRPQRLVPGQTGAFKVQLEGLVEDVRELQVRVVDYEEP